MGEPYHPAMIATLLRGMPAERLKSVEPTDFHRWPVRHIVASQIIRELISNEIARRA